MILAFSGKKSAGKDTAAEILIEEFGFSRIGLADALKEMCANVFKMSLAAMNDPELKNKDFQRPFTFTRDDLNKLFDYIGKYESIDTRARQLAVSQFTDKSVNSLRELLQVVGTDIIREYVGSDLWINIGLEKIKKMTHKNVVITDCRFGNERSAFRKMGAKLVLIKRSNTFSLDGHASENDLGSDHDYDEVFYNAKELSQYHNFVRSWAKENCK